MNIDLNIKAMYDCEFGAVQLTEGYVKSLIELGKQHAEMMATVMGNPASWSYSKVIIGDLGCSGSIEFECGDVADGEPDTPAGISVWVKTGYEDNDADLPATFTRIA